MRTLRSSWALIQQKNGWLVQWNSRWQAYTLMGGAVDDGESFGDRAVSAAWEAFHCDPQAVESAPFAYAQSQFQEYSPAMGDQIQHHWQVFLDWRVEGGFKVPSDSRTGLVQ